MIAPYYDSDGIQIYCADSCEWVMQHAPEAEVIITDPPYGETSLEWDKWVSGWPSVARAALTLGGSMWCFGSMRMFLNHIGEFELWKFAQDIVWEKHNGSGFHADRFKRVHEHALQFYPNGEPWSEIYANPVFTMDAVKHTMRRKQRPTHMGSIGAASYSSEDGGPRLMRSVIYARSMQGTALSPTQKPLAIILPLIEYSCPSGGLVLDLFCGSGSTLVAAKQSGRRAIGIDCREEECEKSAKRLSQGVLNFLELEKATV